MPDEVFEAFKRLDIRVARILSAQPNPKARKPAYILTLDCGPEWGLRTSSAQITELYPAPDLVGRQVLALVNLQPRRVAGMESEVLVLGLYSQDGVILIGPERPAQPGDRLG